MCYFVVFYVVGVVTLAGCFYFVVLVGRFGFDVVFFDLVWLMCYSVVFYVVGLVMLATRFCLVLSYWLIFLVWLGWFGLFGV